MYESFFGFHGRPFQLNPDPAFYFASRGHSSAYAYLKFGAYQGEGFIVVTGEIGAGKTTLVRALLRELDPARVVAGQLVSTQLDENDLLRAISASFGLTLKSASKAELIATLEAYFTLLASRGQRALLVVDEAQNLSQAAIEELRLLSNFQLGDTPLLQSFLIGQPELRDKLASASMEQLRQRVIASYHLGPMDEAETHGYVEHRLRHVGWNGDPQIAPEVYGRIHAWARGLPRKINTLSNRLLLAAYLAERHAIDTTDVDALISELARESGRTDSLAELRPASHNVVSLDPARTLPTPAAIGVHEAPPRATRKRARPARSEAGSAADRAGPLICVIAGRSSYVKLAPVIRALGQRDDVPEVVLVQADQALDYVSCDQLYADLDLPAADVKLEIDGPSAPARIADALRRFEPVLHQRRPSCVAIAGAGDSGLGCALAASRSGVPVLQMEAGLRSGDPFDPRDLDRALVDRLAEVLYVPEADAHANLLREGFDSERIHIVGSLVIDSLNASRPHAVAVDETLRTNGITPALTRGGYGVLILRRDVDLAGREALSKALHALRAVGQQIPILWPADARTRADIEQFGLGDVLRDLRITSLPTQGYLETIGLLASARIVLTNSGSVQDETTGLGIPCVTLRAASERRATLVHGTNTLVALDCTRIAAAAAQIFEGSGKRATGPELWDGRAAERIAAHLASWWARTRAPAGARASA